MELTRILWARMAEEGRKERREKLVRFKGRRAYKLRHHSRDDVEMM